MATTTVLRQPEFAGILRDEEVFAIENDNSLGNRINGWFDNLMLQSGLGITPGMILALSLCSAFTVGGFIFVLQENLLTTAFGAAFGSLLPILITIITRSRRQSKITSQLPPMIDELARAAKTGRSLEKSLALVAHDTPSPLGDELLYCTRKLEMGLSVENSLKELPQRTGVVATSVLVTALSVHMQTGGDLVKVLERLSQTLRDRIQFLGRLKAATAASRATAVLMIVLPPAIVGFFVLRDGEYLTTLLESTWGMRITVTAVVLELIGAMWVLRILKTSEKV
ncbi:type II secretion system F family protein [Thalassoglobus polymorphus]|uniref:Bacterial type II secretion system protein F domain protein n=1 Tax=Thalassoglobus polymorphus TaxID=2527994 RepID=A0A517QT09_9PLAN|nr:type II secretion system F family protein [Thalassoglobus polymorphus]QDT34785.1 Bacterial type II secretion system protein F domain protein [Thalassoglobus polymorphus]